MTNREIANEILYRIGDRPIPFESVREIALQIYHELEGTEPDESFDDIYEILLSILPLTHRGADIDDYNVSTGTTWSSSKITSVLEDYVTNNDASVFLTANDVSNFVTNDDMDSSLSNYYTKDEIDASLDNKADKTELENYATLNDISTFLVPNDVSIYATTEAVNQGLELKQDTLIAGDNITILDNVISAEGDVFDASNYYTKDEIDASLADKADKAELDDYATKNDISTFITENDASIYLTDEDLEGYATEEFVNSSLGNYYTKSDASTLFNPYNTVAANSGANFPTWNERGQITGSYAPAYSKILYINGHDHSIWKRGTDEFGNIYAPTTAGTAGQYLVSSGSGAPVWKDLSDDTSIYLTANDISTFVTESELANYATKNDISTFITENDASIYLTANDISTLVSESELETALSDYATKNDISTFITENDSSIYAIKSDVDASLNSKQDTLTAGTGVTITNNVISASAVGAQVVELTQDEYDALVTKDENTLYIITDAPAFDPSNYYTKDEVDDILDDYATKNDVSAFITEDDLAGYATKEFVNTSLGNYYTKAQVDTSLADKVNRTELTDYATKNDVSTFITENDASIYLTSSDLNGYATESFVNSSLANYATTNDVSAFLTANDASVLYNPYNTVAANDAGTAWFPIWNNRGQVIGHNWSAFRKDLTINGEAKKIWGSVLNETISSFYAPTTTGAAGQYLVSSGSGAPVWKDLSDDTSAFLTANDASVLYNPYNTVTPNETNPNARFVKWNARGQIVGEAYTAYSKQLTINGVGHPTWRANLVDFPSIYAPTTAGTSGQYLVSSGSGAPVWKDLSNDTSAFLTANDTSIYAEKTYVDASLNAKANTSYVDSNFAKLSILTQAEYDALVQGGTVDASTLYIISNS